MAKRHEISQASASRILRKGLGAQVFGKVNVSRSAENQAEGRVEVAIEILRKLAKRRMGRGRDVAPR